MVNYFFENNSSSDFRENHKSINMEKRLELIKMLRCEQAENIGRIQKRERILYPGRKLSYAEEMNYEGRNRIYGDASDWYSQTEEGQNTIPSRPNYGFYMRLGICMGLFFAFVYMETQNISYLGITHEQIQNAVAKTIDVNSFAFMEQFPYTLEE